jgi:cobalt-zinc-cadmium efflux system membrane fusion protein
LVFLVGLAIVGGVAYSFRDQLLHELGQHPTEPPTPPRRVEFSNQPWDGTLTLTSEAQAAIGLAVAPVTAQTEATPLPVLGTTKHDETKLTKIRPFFRGRVDKVHVGVGEKVTPDMPLVDLYSADLARAKTDFVIERSQWQYEKKLLDRRTELAKTNAITGTLLLETQSREMRERHEYEVAREKLQVFGLTDKEIAHVDQEQGEDKARLTLRSPATGIVIRRDVVSGNLYDENDVLMTIAPGDHLWVWGNVFESNLSLVHLGQKWVIEFPFSGKTLTGNVEFIAEGVDPETHAVRVRTSIPNVGGQFKADMLVRGHLEVEPEPGNVAIPRSALVIVDGNTYAFVREPGTSDKFVRRVVQTSQEKNDQAIVRSGLEPGEEVVVTGALFLEQMYEDQATLHM